MLFDRTLFFGVRHSGEFDSLGLRAESRLDLLVRLTMRFKYVRSLRSASRDPTPPPARGPTCVRSGCRFRPCAGFLVRNSNSLKGVPARSRRAVEDLQNDLACTRLATPSLSSDTLFGPIDTGDSKIASRWAGESHCQQIAAQDCSSQSKSASAKCGPIFARTLEWYWLSQCRSSGLSLDASINRLSNGAKVKVSSRRNSRLSEFSGKQAATRARFSSRIP